MLCFKIYFNSCLIGFEIQQNTRIFKYNKNTLKTVLKYHRRRKAIARIYYENTSKIGCKNAKKQYKIVRKQPQSCLKTVQKSVERALQQYKNRMMEIQFKFMK